MKLAILAVLAFVICFALFAGTDNSDHKTDYQACMDAAKHLRSDNDTNAMKRICDSLPVDPRDMR